MGSGIGFFKVGGRGGKDDFCGWDEAILGKVENFIGAKALDGGSFRDMYIWVEGEPETALKDKCVGEGSELFQWVTASPLKMAEGSMRPASA